MRDNFSEPPSRGPRGAAPGNVGLWLAVGGGALFILTCVAVALFVVKLRSANAPGTAGTPATPGNPAVTQAPPRPAAPTLSAEDEKALAELGKKVADTVNAGDGKFLDSQFNADKLLDRAFAGLEVDAGFRRGFSSGLKKTMLLGTATVKNAHDAKATMKFLRVHHQDDENRLLLRLYGDTLTYLDICVEKTAPGKFDLVDVYNYSTGEAISLTMRRMILPMIVEQNKSYLEKLVGSESESVKAFPDIMQFSTLAQQGQWAGAMAKYKTLPQSVREEKTILLVRLTVANHISDAETIVVVNDLQRLYPADPALDLIVLDRYLADKKYELYQATIDHLEKRLGADACLEHARANGYYTEKKLPEAKKSCAAAVQLEPDFENAYWTLVTISLDEKKYDDTVQWLNAFEKNIGPLKSDLGGNQAYKDFFLTDQYKQWKAQHSKPAGPPK